jgi:hypothetical protein
MSGGQIDRNVLISGSGTITVRTSADIMNETRIIVYYTGVRPQDPVYNQVENGHSTLSLIHEPLFVVAAEGNAT